jgi:hypothetical protein
MRYTLALAAAGVLCLTLDGPMVKDATTAAAHGEAAAHAY